MTNQYYQSLGTCQGSTVKYIILAHLDVVEPTSLCVPHFQYFKFSEISKPIAIKFCLKQHWGEGKAAIGFMVLEFRFPWQHIAPIGL